MELLYKQDEVLPDITSNRWLLANFEGDNRNNNKQDYQDDGKLKQGLFNAPSGTKDTISLAKYAPQSAAPNLKQDR